MAPRVLALTASPFTVRIGADMQQLHAGLRRTERLLDCKVWTSASLSKDGPATLER